VPDFLPPVVARRPRTNGFAYDLPRRPLGRLRWLSVFLIVLGVAFAGGPLFGVLWFGSGGPSNDVFDLIGILFAAIFMVPGGAVVLLGLAMLTGASSIELRGGTLVAVERLGPLRWRRRRPGGRLTKIDVRRGTTRVNGRVVTEGTLAEMAAIMMSFENARPLVAAIGYPEQWLLPLANRLAADVESVRPARLLAGDEPAGVQVVRTTEREVDPCVRPVSRPPDTQVTLTQNADGLTMTVPPAGLLKGSRGLFAFSILWCGFMVVFSGFSVAVPLVTGSFSSQLWPFVAGSAVFWAIGIAMMVAAVNMGRRHAIIDVVDDVLLINRKSLFRIKSHQWLRQELETVTVGPSGIESNDVPILELKVRPRAGKDVGMFAGRDQAELRWMAWALSDHLNLTGVRDPQRFAADAQTMRD